jgi:hypothetical protein
LGLRSVDGDVERMITVFGVQVHPDLGMDALVMVRNGIDVDMRVAGQKSKLKHLDLSGASKMRLEELIVIMNTFHTLTHLGLRGCRSLDVFGVHRLLETCKDMTSLDLTDGPKGIYFQLTMILHCIVFGTSDILQLSQPVTTPVLKYTLNIQSKPEIQSFHRKLDILLAESRNRNDANERLRTIQGILVFLCICATSYLFYGLLALYYLFRYNASSNNPIGLSTRCI